MPQDQAKLDEFVGKMLNDMGAVATGAMVLIGDKLGLATRPSPRRGFAGSPPPSSPRGPGRRSVMSANGWRPRRRRGMSSIGRRRARMP